MGKRFVNLTGRAIALAASLSCAEAAVAMPAVSVAPGVASGQADIVRVRGGCGLGFHPNVAGFCVPNRRFYGVGPVVVAPRRLPPPCPPGYYRDPDPLNRICYPR